MSFIENNNKDSSSDFYGAYADDDHTFNHPMRRKKNSGKKLYFLLIVLFLASCALLIFMRSGSFKLKDSPTVQNAQKAQTQQVVINQASPGIQKSAAPLAAGGKVLSIKEIVKKNKPAVVGVVSKIQNGGYLSQGTGSGIIMSQDGYIITNYHVIENAQNVSVILSDSREYVAVIVGKDRKSDLAVLKINEKNLTYAEFGDSDQLEEGDLAVAIGNPIGLELSGTVTSGIISAVNRDLTIDDRVMTLLQTDASINPGNSGGPLINEYGQVIGINSIKIGASDIEGLGFAIPINVAKPIIDGLIADGYVKNRPAIGISGRDISKVTSSYYDIPQGVYVDYVNAKSNAVSAGLKKGDIITKINGKSVNTMSELNFEKDKYKAGDTVTLTVFRENKELSINIVLMEEKPE